MGIMHSLLWACLHLLCIGFDIAIFFLLVRLALGWKYMVWLDLFDRAGQPLVKYITESVDKASTARTKGPFTERHNTLIALAILLWARFMLALFRQVI